MAKRWALAQPKEMQVRPVFRSHDVHSQRSLFLYNYVVFNVVS